jgi:hypothetical protein
MGHKNIGEQTFISSRKNLDIDTEVVSQPNSHFFQKKVTQKA